MLYERIEGLCKSKGISIRHLERECGLSYGSVIKWRTSSPSAVSLLKVAQYLETTVEELVREE